MANVRESGDTAWLFGYKKWLNMCFFATSAVVDFCILYAETPHFLSFEYHVIDLKC